MHLFCRNVNDAFRRLVSGIDEGDISTVRRSSRAGDILQVPEPVLVTYGSSTERVLFNKARDANCFLHLFEALWMLAGRNDVAPMSYYSSGIADIASDNGKTFNGAYGYRWRKAFGGDQLDDVILDLTKNKNNRRVVLSMWAPCNYTSDDGERGVARDAYSAQMGTKDVPCNTHAYFLVNHGRLDMTVCNRSNDLIWGMLGANVVHFSILQEYLAAHIGIPVGMYNQFTNNLHVYTERWEPEKWLNDPTLDYYIDNERKSMTVRPYPLVDDPKRFDLELDEFNRDWLGQDLTNRVFQAYYREPFIQRVAFPMARAFHFHKVRDYEASLRACGEIEADDWRIVATGWITQRRDRYEKRNPYVEREFVRQGIKQEVEE